jgi:starvation-inducible DNA-binding protein
VVNIFDSRKDNKAMGKSSASQSAKRAGSTFEPATDLSHDAVREISSELRKLLADVFALYVKTKNFHWHMSGRQFRDYHLLLDEHADQIFAMADDIAERARKIGGTTLRSISDISRHQRLKDNDKESLSPKEKLAELRSDNRELTRSLRLTHEVCVKHNDVATASLIENWIDETERRTWFLSGGSERPLTSRRKSAQHVMQIPPCLPQARRERSLALKVTRRRGPPYRARRIRVAAKG